MGSYIKTKFGLALLKVARLCFFLAFVSFGFQNDFKVSLFTGLPVHFIEPQHPSKFFWRGQFYGEQDDFRRFSYFSRAALELLLQSGKKPDIIHCHDWQTAFVVRFDLILKHLHNSFCLGYILKLFCFNFYYRHHCIGICMLQRD